MPTRADLQIDLLQTAVMIAARNSELVNLPVAAWRRDASDLGIQDEKLNKWFSTLEHHEDLGLIEIVKLLHAEDGDLRVLAAIFALNDGTLPPDGMFLASVYTVLNMFRSQWGKIVEIEISDLVEAIW